MTHALLELNPLVTLVAEIGVNHEGSLEKALHIMTNAAKAGVHAVKFQTYNPHTYISSDDKERFARVSRFALSDQDFISLKKEAQKLGVLFFSTAVTDDKIPFLASLSPLIKIASGDITSHQLLIHAAKSGADIVLSTGAASLSEIEHAVSLLSQHIPHKKPSEKIALLHCVSAYPVPENEAQLQAIPAMAQHFQPITVGYSNHVPSLDAVCAAVALGARIVEVHVTDQKHNRDFRDHALSMDPQDLQKLAEQLPRIALMRGDFPFSPSVKQIMPSEKQNINALRKGIVAACDLPPNTVIREEHLACARPLGPFLPAEASSLYGKTLQTQLKRGQTLLPSHFFPPSTTQS